MSNSLDSASGTTHAQEKPVCPFPVLPAPWKPSSGGKGWRATRVTGWSPPVEGLFASITHEEDYTASGDYRRFKTYASCERRCAKLNSGRVTTAKAANATNGMFQ